MQDGQTILWPAAGLLSTTIGGRELQLTQDDKALTDITNHEDTKKKFKKRKEGQGKDLKAHFLAPRRSARGLCRLGHLAFMK